MSPMRLLMVCMAFPAVLRNAESQSHLPPCTGMAARRNGRCGYAVKLARSRSMDSATSIVSCHVMKGLSFFPSRRRRQSSRTS